MAKDQLYLLRPGFTNANIGPLYCNDSAPVEGALSFFPKLRELVDVHYLDFPRPREVLVENLGVDKQSLPVLIVARGRTLKANTPNPERAMGREFYSNERAIRDYLATEYNLPRPG